MIDAIIQDLEEEVKATNKKPSDERLKQAIDALQKEEASSTEEYILQQYNLCILMASLSEQSMQGLFEDHLTSLNTILSFNNITFQPKSIRIFDKIADLNFKAHRYKEAINYLEKAILLEELSEYDRGEIRKRNKFRRRWLLATCLEYSGLSAISVIDENQIKTAVQLLVGDRVLSFNLEEDKQKSTPQEAKLPEQYDREEIINEIETLEQIELPILKIASLKEKEFKFPNINISEPCLARTVEEWKNELSSELYERMLNDISHIVAHCLSELEKATSKKNRELYQFQHLRFSEILMRKLGEDYITCLATLAIERGEYYVAEDMLERRRLDLVNDVEAELIRNNCSNLSYLECAFCVGSSSLYGKNSFINLIEQIALIDFYLWYFSVIANKNDHDINKKQFLEYCRISKDSTALAYYNVVAFKELLIEGFSFITSEMISIDSPDFQNVKAKIHDAYMHFNNHKPNWFIHNSIQDEWVFLHKAYAVFNMCCSALCKPEEIVFYAYKTIELFDKPQKAPIEGEKELGTAPFYLVRGKNGSFCYKGNVEVIEGLGKMYSVDFKFYSIETRPEVYFYGNKSISNILIILNSETVMDSVKFIEDILEMEMYKKLPRNEQHTFFIDYSGLSEKEKTDFEENYPNIIDNDNIHNFDDTSNANQAFLLCVMFSRIEKVLSTLHKPLNSYMISPISNDITYKEQYGEDLLSVSSLLKTIDIKQETSSSNDRVTTARFNRGSTNVISACLPTCRNDTFNGLTMEIRNFASFVHNYRLINHIFVFTLNGTNDDTQLLVNHFDIKSHLDLEAESISSDTIYINDKQMDLQKVLYRLSHSITDRKIKRDTTHCVQRVCISSKTLVEDIKNKKENRTLYDYLLFYVGLSLDQSAILLLQDRSEVQDGAEETSRYLLFVLDSNFTMDDHTVCDYCRAFQKENKLIKSAKEAMHYVRHYSPSYNSLLCLKNQIQAVDKHKKFVFISYRAKRGLRKLCEPVYRDVIYLQKKYPQISFFIDVKNLEDTPDTEIEEIIKDSNCVGALIYLSPDYFFHYKEEKIIPASEDACLKEAELLLKKGENCFIYPIYLSETLAGSSFEGNLKAEEFVEKALIKFQEIRENERYRTYHSLFECEQYTSLPKRTILTHELFEHHFERTQEGDNFVNTIEKLISRIENEKTQETNSHFITETDINK